MPHIFVLNIKWISTIFAFLIALAVIFVRMKAAKQPTSAKKILIPPLAMCTGFLMFLNPEAQVPFSWAVLSFLAGAIFFSYPLIRSSQFERVGVNVYLKRSKSFIVILLALLLIRVILHDYVEQYVSVIQTGAIFFVLAFGMLLPWRIAMFIQYRRLLEDGTAMKKG